MIGEYFVVNRERDPDPLKHLGAVINGWTAAGAGFLGAPGQQVTDRFLGAMTEGERYKFNAFCGAGEFWRDGRLEINTITPKQVEYMKGLEHALFEFGSRESQTDLGRVMSDDLLMAVRGVREACQHRVAVQASRPADGQKR